MEGKYPVLYYDLGNIDLETLHKLAEQLEEYFKREKIPFILLPKQMDMEWITKEEALKRIESIKEYVETWPE